MSATVYKLINRSEREVLLSLLSASIARWMEQYAAGDPSTRCTLLVADESALDRTAARQWIHGTRPSATEPALAIGLGDGWERDLAGLVLGERQGAALDPAGKKLIRELSSELFAQLGQTVLDALLAKRKDGAANWISFAEERPLAAHPGDSRVVYDCRLGDRLTVLLILSPATVLECLANTLTPAAAVQLEPLARALQSETVVLEAIVGEAEIPVEELGTLSVGDVIKLNRKIHQPVQLSVRGGGPVCVARLGALRGRTALQLT
jgi:Type III flagellar switch regulator (C-ring) FliN C-term